MISLLPLLSALLAVAPAGGGAADPRIEWVELQRSGRLEQALVSVERHLATLPAGAPTLAAHYLRGDLLATLGRYDLASPVLAASLADDAELAPWIRYRLAETEIARGHPEVAAGLLATLLGARPPAPLTTFAATLLAETLRRGGDCRLLTALDSWPLDTASSRLLRLSRAGCHRAEGLSGVDAELLTLLAEDTTDGVALAAAERLDTTRAAISAEANLDVALAFFGQRSFDRALDYFSRALASGALPASRRDDYDLRYSVARSHFWLGDYSRAAESFGDLILLAGDAAERARAHYQRARAFELAGNTAAADAAFADAVAADPHRGWAAAALVSRLRLSWLGGRENEALVFYQQLASRSRWQGSRARAALFLAASDLVQGRADRAGAWLGTAAATTGTHLPELAYWQGRQAEASGDLDRAVDRYRAALVDSPYDPWALDGRARLAAPALAELTARATARLAATGRDRDLLAAWLMAPESATGSSARASLHAQLRSRETERTFLELTVAPTTAWPFWQRSLSRPEERLMAVGAWRAAAPVLANHFPAAEPRLALTRSRLLAEGGLTRPSILAAEILARRAPSTVPVPLWPTELLRQLYPLAHGGAIRHRAQAAGFDPRLLAALIREESRFDAGATSPAAARGLTQFVLPTARRLGRQLGMPEILASDLHRPEVAIELGAAYLAELGTLFSGRNHQMLAAYNAGEAQAALWRGYCFSDERAEFLSKVGFRETRGYLRKVLTSYAHYRELYRGSDVVEATTRLGTAPSASSK